MREMGKKVDEAVQGEGDNLKCLIRCIKLLLERFVTSTAVQDPIYCITAYQRSLSEADFPCVEACSPSSYHYRFLHHRTTV